MKVEPLQAIPATPTILKRTPEMDALDAHTIRTGRALVLLRSAWLAGILLYLGLFLLGIPGAYSHALLLSTETQTALARLGLGSNLPALYWLMLDSLTMLGFAAIAIFIVIRRPNDWLVMLTSLTLVGTAALYTDPPSEAQVPLVIIACAFALAEIFQVAFVYLFPNGRFVPRRTGLLLLPLFIWRPVIWTLVYVPNYLASIRTGENYGTLRQDTLDTGLMIVLFAIGIGTQIYRYRRVATPTQKLQTKWLVFGIVSAILVAASYVIVVNALGLVETAGLDALLLRMVGRTVRQVALFMLPLTLAFSILRYRLWEIDVLIQRSLIYVPLTAILAGMFAALVTVLQKLFIVLTGQQSIIATVFATIIVVAAIEPLEKTIKRIVNERFREPLTPSARLKLFGEHVEARLSPVEPIQIIKRFSDEAVAAFHAAGGAAFIDKDGTLKRISTRGTWSDQDSQIQITVAANNKRIGAIALGARPLGRDYSERDRMVLIQAALTVGAAIEQDEM